MVISFMLKHSGFYKRIQKYKCIINVRILKTNVWYKKSNDKSSNENLKHLNKLLVS